MSKRQVKGVTLLESMLLVVVMGIVSLGFGIALQSSAHIPDGVDRRLTIHTFLVEKMEDIASLDFAAIAANGLSDTVVVNGQTLARTVAVMAIDADGINGVDNDYLEVKVTIGDQYLKTRVTQP